MRTFVVYTRGLIRKDTASSVIQSTHPLVLEKHELHSNWPIYHIPDDHEQTANEVYARIYRKQTCYAPGDKVEARIILTSKNVSPVKIKTVALSIRETVTFRGSKRGSRMLGGVTKTANQKTEMIAQKAQQVGSKIYKGDTKTFDIALVVPKSHSLMTIQTAKHIEISYTMRVYVDTKQPIIIDHLPLTITTTPASVSGKVVPQIGYVPGLSAPAEYPQEEEEPEEQVRRPQSMGPSVSFRPQQPDFQPHDFTADTQQAYRPVPYRSLSLTSSDAMSNASTERAGRPAGGADLHRRDTVMTTSTAGPGMAGRGVPGGIHSWGQLGAAQPYAAFGTAQGPVRGAFAGPPSIYEGRELNQEENRALYHHSLANNLGEVFEGQQVLPEAPAHVRVSTAPTMASVPESAEQHARGVLDSHRHDPAHSMPQSTSWGRAESSSTVSAAQAAEMEKERLYRRAREQAERNQRRAAQAAVATSTSHDRNGMTADYDGAGVQQPPLSAVAQRQADNNEKQILYQRARRQAEQYQGQYESGADFPSEDSSINPGMSRNSSNFSLGTNGSQVTSAAMGATAMAALGSRGRSVSPEHAATGSSKPRTGPAPVTAYASAEEEKRKLYEAAMAERDSYLNNQNGDSSRSSGSAMVGSNGQSPSQVRPVSTAPTSSRPTSPRVSVFPTAEEEKRRFAAAKAETDAYLASGGQSSSRATGSGSAMNSSLQPFDQANSASAPGPANTFPSAEEEKRRLYQTAKAQVEANPPTSQPASKSTGVGGSDAPSQNAVGSSGGVPRSSAAAYAAPTQPSYVSAEEEKRRLYERAKAEVDGNQAHIQPSQSMAPTGAGVAADSSATSKAEDEKAQLRRYHEAKDAVARHQQGASSSASEAATVAPALARPEASYASGYRSASSAGATSGGLPASSTIGEGVPPLPNPYDQQPTSTAAQQVPPSYSRPAFLSSSRNPSLSGSEAGSIFSSTTAPYRTPSVVAGKQRTLPSAPPSPAPPALPTLNFQPFEGLHSSSSSSAATATPTPMRHSAGGLYAPRVAPSNWHDLDEDGSGVDGARKVSGPAPPIPPKTPLGASRGI